MENNKKDMNSFYKHCCVLFSIFLCYSFCFFFFFWIIWNWYELVWIVFSFVWLFCLVVLLFGCFVVIRHAALICHRSFARWQPPWAHPAPWSFQAYRAWQQLFCTTSCAARRERFVAHRIERCDGGRLAHPWMLRTLPSRWPRLRRIGVMSVFTLTTSMP